MHNGAHLATNEPPCIPGNLQDVAVVKNKMVGAAVVAQ